MKKFLFALCLVLCASVAGAQVTLKPFLSSVGGVTVPGSDTEVIFNDGGALGADAGLVYNKTTNVLSVAGSFTSPAASNVVFNTPAATQGQFQVGGANRFAWDTSQFFPQGDNAFNLGISSVRWANLFVVNINSTSIPTTIGPIQVNGGTGLTNKNAYFTGTINHATPAAVYFDTALTGLTGAAGTAQGFYVGPSFSLSGNYGDVQAVNIPATTVTLNGFTVDNATSLDIAGPPTNGTTKRSIWVRTGLTQLATLTATTTNVTDLVASNDVSAGAARFFYWPGRSNLVSGADGNIRLANNATTDFGLLQFGGSTSSYPAIKRNATGLDVRLADDSAYARITSGYAAAGATPSVGNVGANSCGTTAASIAGNNNAGNVTVGATSGTQCRVTFTVAATTRWHCTVTNETTGNLLRWTYVDTTHGDLVGVMVAGDTLTYLCMSR